MKLTYRQWVNTPDKMGRCLIFLDIAWQGQRARLSTGVKCQPENFTPAKALKVQRELNKTQLNTRLADIEKTVLQVFNQAEALNQPVVPAQLEAAVKAILPRKKKLAAPEQEVAPEKSFAQLYALWQKEHPGQGTDAARRYQQVLGRLEDFHPGFTLAQLSKVTFYDYLGYLQQAGLSDSTIAGHVKFLRVCFLLSEQLVPSWLKFTAKYGRAASLRRDEFTLLLQLTDLPPYLQREKERTIFQTQLLLRDSDLRKLKAHNVAVEDVAGVGPIPVLRLYQTKTNEYLTLPLPPAAAQIWEAWQGKVPVVVQQKRNLFIKELAQRAGLERGHVRVRFKMGKPEEEVLPMWQAITTHTPRHTGADLVLWGSDGDQNLKELALGHTMGLSAYGYDSLERYAPLLLRAWQKVAVASVFTASSTDSARLSMDVCAVPAAGVGLFPVRFRS
ncbi:phage integrase SAM-like domain-containing protein [Hymenobacter sp. BT188]|uniref:phage integrase SAM-like domain-containing protein n=1 Tax=Hymenobacter sp. BT188 TaxID=2763504 RepID=UPI001650E481|nr:phage integrase SAM-like domain-containing protein [Hymenobacter sp. BT188]MBC6606967.1 phage integrase SAM-like domain-containing protein [Hymenobacter sp. BT188]